jgi:hypothetical protein
MESSPHSKINSTLALSRAFNWSLALCKEDKIALESTIDADFKSTLNDFGNGRLDSGSSAFIWSETAGGGTSTLERELALVTRVVIFEEDDAMDPRIAMSSRISPRWDEM